MRSIAKFNLLSKSALFGDKLTNKFLFVHHLHFRETKVGVQFLLQLSDLLINRDPLSLGGSLILLHCGLSIHDWWRVESGLLDIVLSVVLLLGLGRLLHVKLLLLLLRYLVLIVLRRWLELLLLGWWHLLHLLQPGQLLLVINLLLHNVILHISLSLVNVRLSELILFVLLVLNLLQGLKFIQLHLTTNGLLVTLVASPLILIRLICIIILVVHVVCI